MGEGLHGRRKRIVMNTVRSDGGLGPDANAMASINEAATGYPGYNGSMPFENGFLSEMLQQRGYSTYLVVAAVFIQRLFTAYPAPDLGLGDPGLDAPTRIRVTTPLPKI
jgi:hypothetical protein